VFRRRTATSAAKPAEGQADTPGKTAGRDSGSAGSVQRPAGTPGKGRPTPKRREAAPRRQPIAAPGTRKEAYRSQRERQRADRTKRAEGLRRGDERYLPAKDQGPVKALARDYVDSRRMLSEYYLYAAGVMIIFLFVPTLQPLVYPLILATLVTVITEGLVTGRRVRKLAAQRFPGESTRGVALYAVMRSAQIRKFRLPPPRVKRGAKI
jgi:Protein of unknown function (DUF3043)